MWLFTFTVAFLCVLQGIIQAQVLPFHLQASDFLPPVWPATTQQDDHWSAYFVVLDV